MYGKIAILKEVEQLASSKEYDKLLSLLSDALTILPNDSDFTSKQIGYTKINEKIKAAERKQKIAELIKSQEVSVEKISTFTDWLDGTNISIVVRNNTKKVVKKFSISWMGFDSAGYPVKTGWLSPDFVQDGNAENNIQPGQSFGSGYGWALTGGFDKEVNAKKFLACVKEVEYYDGTTWTNPYYEVWLEEYKEKPYH